MHPFPARGLYAVTPERLHGRPLIDAVSAALVGGAKVIQYRNKSTSKEGRETDARALVSLCHEHNVPLIINDDVALAASTGADGVHVGREDASLAHARAALGPEAIIGASCYNEVPLAQAAMAGGASYIAFGSFFPSATKPGAVRATVSLVAQVRQTTTLPIVGIGGITATNAPPLIDSGVDVLAVVNAIFGGSDPRRGALAFTQLF